MGRKKGEYNCYYSEYRTVKYATCNYWEVPAPQPFMEMHKLMMDDIEKARIMKENYSKSKKNCPSYSRKYWNEYNAKRNKK